MGAKDKGFDVDPIVLERAKGYLRNIEAYIPSWWPADTRRALVAYALNVRWRMHDADRARAWRLVAEAGGAPKLSLEADGWILSVLSGDPGSTAEVAQIRRHLANRVTETSGAAHFGHLLRRLELPHPELRPACRRRDPRGPHPRSAEE